jgi:hypothetical protein
VMSEPVRKFGPFLSIPCSDIWLAGWRCQQCRRQVEVFAIVVPALVPRMIFPRLQVRHPSSSGKTRPRVARRPGLCRHGS